MSSAILVPAVRSDSRFYRPELDALRFFAFLGVFTFHVIPHDPLAYAQLHLPLIIVSLICAISGAGAFGVDLFFALSAYLITTLLLREKELRGTIDVKAFYLRRILRIWPVYFFFLGFAVIVQHVELPYIAGYLLLAGNWVYTWKGLPEAVIVIPLWSISVEEQFYLLWPWVVRKVSLSGMKYVLLGLLAAGYLSRAILASLHVTGAVVEYNTFARIDAIVLGIGLAMACKTVNLSLPARIALAGTCLGIWFAVSPYAGLNAPRAEAPMLGTLLGRPLVAMAAVGLLAACIDAPLTALRNPVLTYLGRISYGLYVYHMAGLMFAKYALRTNSLGSHLGRAVLGFALTVLISAASYRWLETPFLRMKERCGKAGVRFKL